MKLLITSCLMAFFLNVLILNAEQPGIIKSEFIYEQAPYPSCHASTIVEIAPNEFLAAWFGGTKERDPDVEIWLSHYQSGKWSTPISMANGIQPEGPRLPCWNPVLFKLNSGEILLFYKVGPSPSTWWGMLRRSSDLGKTWSAPEKLPDGILGPIKNKPVQLADGTLINPSSSEGHPEKPSWRLQFEISKDQGKSWELIKVPVKSADPDAIQPSILFHSDGNLQAIGRTKAGKIFSVDSKDHGQSWQNLHLTELPNPSSGTDALTLKNGKHVLIYNHIPKGRTPLNIAISDDGKNWQAALILENEPGEYSYPAIIQSSDGLLHTTYTWKRQRIKHTVLDPQKFKLTPIKDGVWPKE